MDQMKITPRKAFYFERQMGLCYLQATLNCQRREGKMRLEATHKDRDGATWDHLVARSKAMKGISGDPSNKLLACKDCNMDKASKTQASWIQHGMAVRIWRQWQKENGSKQKRVTLTHSEPATIP